MDEKINLKAIEQYSEQYAEKILNPFFSTHARITGPEIVALCDIKQINFFILHEIFKAWKGENKKIQSPYFDYAAAPVKEALEVMMRTLSNHIAVDRSHFAPMLVNAVRNTLLLILDPYDFFSDLIAGNGGKPLEVEQFREQLKYMKINRAPLEKLLQKLESGDSTELSGNAAFALLDQILEEVNFTPEDIDDYLAKFSAVLPLRLENFYEQQKQQDMPKVIHQPTASNTPKPPVIQQQPVTTQQVSKAPIYEKSIAERKPTVASNFQKISKIKDSLTINQKFMFTKVLFHGDFELFSKAVDDLDRLDNMTTALQYLEQNFEEWDRESEEFHEFMELVEKRFGVS